MNFKDNNFDSSDYQKFKANALNTNRFVRQMVPFTQLRIVNDSVIDIMGVNFPMTEQAFKTFVKLLGLSTTQLNNITNILDSEVTSQLVKMIQLSLSASKKDSICVVIDTVDATVVNFAKTAEGILSTSSYFDLFERTMNNHSGMVIKNMSISQEGNIHISVKNNNWEFNLGNDAGLKDEYFKSGLVFINNASTTIITPFNERLICTNGMIITDPGLSLTLKAKDANSVSDFFSSVINLQGVTNVEAEFKTRIIRMMNTKASFSELNKVYNSVVSEVVLNEISSDMINEYFPVSLIKKAYLQKGYDLNTVKDAVHKQIATMMTVWDLVNKLTDISSHPVKYNLTLKNGNDSVFNMQRTAGAVCFKQSYDLEQTIPNIF